MVKQLLEENSPNLPDDKASVQNIELQFLAKVFRFHMKSAGFHEIHMKSGGFHEIRMKSGGFQVKSTPNLVKSEEFLLKHLHLISETSDFT